MPMDKEDLDYFYKRLQELTERFNPDLIDQLSRELCNRSAGCYLKIGTRRWKYTCTMCRKYLSFPIIREWLTQNVVFGDYLKPEETEESSNG